MSEHYPYGAAGDHGAAGPQDAAGQQGTPAGGYPSSAPVPPTTPTPPASPAPPLSSPPTLSSPPPAPTSQTLTAGQVSTALRKVGIGNPLPTFLIGAAAYIVALAAALLVVFSVFLALLTVDTGSATGTGTVPTDPPGGSGPGADPSSAGAGWRVIVGLVGIPFQLVSLAAFGSYDVEMGLGTFLGTMSMSWRGMPLLITTAMVATAFFATRFVQRRWGTGRWGSNGPLGAVLWSGISGLAVATFALIATRLTAFSVADDELEMSLSMHSAGADMFFGTWLLITLALFLGHAAGMEKPAWWPIVADLAAAPRLALTHALAFALPVGILAAAGGAIALLIDGEGRSLLTLALMLPAWGPTAFALLPGLGLLTVPLHAIGRGDLSELGFTSAHEFLWFVDLPWYAWIPLVLIALPVPVLMALLWHRDREVVPGNILALVVSWAALPVAYAGCSLILLGLVWTSTQAQLGWFLGDVAVSVGLAPWMPVAALFLGLFIEVLARYGAPVVDRFVPGFLVNWFRRSARARRTGNAS